VAVEINWLAVLVASVVGTFVGNLWFGPKTFFPIWWKFMGKSPEDQPGGANMGLVFGLTFVAIAVQAIVLEVVLQAVGGPTWWAGLATGALLGLIGSAASLTHKLFGGLSLRAWGLEAGSDIVGLAAMGLVLGLFG
jgi:uncharacterized membrane protein YbhN (UPF0104 family)